MSNFTQVQHAYARPTAGNWRQICDCQYHGGSWSRRVAAGAGRLLERTAIRYRRILVTLPVAFGAFVIPMHTLDAIPAERREEAIQEMRHRLLIDVAFPSGVPTIASDIETTDTYVINGFPDSLARALVGEWMMEKVREEFFRQEIPYGWIIYREARRNDLPPDLVAAVVRTESNFKPNAVSEKNAQGLMQLIPSTGLIMGARDLMDPVDNVRAGTKYLKYLYRRFGEDSPLALAAYNAGEGNVARFGGVPPFRETKDYLRKIAHSRQMYNERLQQRVEDIMERGAIDEFSIFTQ